MSNLDAKPFAPLLGGCHCGAVRYEITALLRRHSLCHCTDCRRSAGAFAIGWAVVPDRALHVTGTTASYNSSGDVERLFCPRCGTGLFYRSATLFPGEVDVRTGSLDAPDVLPPTEVIQLADAPIWWDGIGNLPHHRRFPGDDAQPS